MSKETPEKHSKRLSAQNEKDRLYVTGMKENPRKAIIRELSNYWNFEEISQKK
ncbi:hypothetical protein [Sphingopyxis sp. GW247-27LB]|uniref:hypothetical protein n=1 Tax=Sphingopyxis sp. GW247-27LB TaxID=2012632 RepID=UPI0015958AAF|nr:hypothetical protein [Sphingopyxis sp. GW247-27LB]